MNSTITNTRSGGFTLIELAIVLVIIGVLVGSFIGTIGSRIDTTRRAETVAALDEIKQAILGYAYSSPPGQASLPCPDCEVACTGGIANDGREDRDGSKNCSLSYGNLPWVTLGLGRSDVWNTRYGYWVDTTFSNQAPAFGLTDTGSGRILTRVPAIRTLANNVVMVVFTHGKNTYGGTTADGNATPAIPAGNVDEAENADGDNTFISREPTLAGASSVGGEFDDIVIWLPEYELKAKMVDVGLLPYP
jgi:prepilin-type N-terminal cleavage/methylation domain-containing protein